LGDPISIRVAGYSLSLRLNEADQIILEHWNARTGQNENRIVLWVI
jgi:hypothetical protein